MSTAAGVAELEPLFAMLEPALAKLLALRLVAETTEADERYRFVVSRE